MPYFEQLFVAAKGAPLQGIALERLAYCLRRRTQHETGVYFASLSCRTLVYKGMLTTEQLELVFPELLDERMASALAVVHSRFSTNTFPAWELAHPFRMIAHNGEINTVKGNRNWMRAREALLASDVIPGDLERLFPICTPDASDSASFDEVVELLHLGGRSLPHAMLMMIPEAWENNAAMDQAPEGLLRLPLLPDGALGRAGRRGLHRRHPDRRRCWTATGCGRAATGSPTTAWWCSPPRPACSTSRRRRIVREGPAAAGQDVPGRPGPAPDHLRRGGQGPDSPRAAPYGEWLLAGRMLLSDLPEREHVVHSHASVTRRQQVFGYTEEDLRLILAPMAAQGCRADRLDGHRHPDRRAERQAAAAVRLLLPAVRPGDQPAAGRHPRGAGHLAVQHHRPGVEPARPRPGVLPPASCCPSRCSTTTR